MNEGQVMHAMCIDDVYHVDRTLAQGPGGTTELVSVGTAGPFVRKKIPPQLAHRRVWATLAECSSPRLPNVETTYELPDCFVVVYDYVPGETLEDRVSGKGHLAQDEAVQLAGQICEAVQALHEHGIFHRDLSPTNIVIAADGAHLIDLGIARMHRENTSRDTTPLGTYGFAAPEQYGFAQSDERTDVYSIGRLLGYMLTGEKPNDENTAYDDALADEGRVPARLRRVIERACNFEPSARYQAACDLAAALAGDDAVPAAGAGAAGAGRSASGAGASARKNDGDPSEGTADARQAAAPQAQRPSGSRGHLAAVAVAFLLALCLGLGIGWYMSWRDAEPLPEADTSQEEGTQQTEKTNETASGETETSQEEGTQQAEKTNETVPDDDGADDATADGGKDSATSSTQVATEDKAASKQADTSAATANDVSQSTAASQDRKSDSKQTASKQADASDADDGSEDDAAGSKASSATSTASSGAAASRAQSLTSEAATQGDSGTDTSAATATNASQGTAAAATPAASGTTITPAASGSEEGLQLGQTLWTMGDNGYINVAIEFVNTSSTQKYIAPQAHITARSQDGSVLLSDNEGIMYASPGSSSWKYASHYVGQEPASVEITLDDSALFKTSGSAAPAYSVSNVHFVTDSIGWASITGDVACTQDGSVSGSRLALTLIFRDADGNFVGGAFGVVDRPDYGQSQAFSIMLHGSIPDYDSYEIYAQVC